MFMNSSHIVLILFFSFRTIFLLLYVIVKNGEGFFLLHLFLETFIINLKNYGKIHKNTTSYDYC